MLRARYVDRMVDGWGPNGADARPRSVPRELDIEAPDAFRLGERLITAGLPPLDQWEESGDDPGLYSVAIIEDDNGAPREDGRWIVDYLIRVDTVSTVPYSLPA